MKRGAVLLVAHPGHELLVHHWMERERPLVLVLTDGSGRAGEPRLEETRRIVLAAGATPGPVFGALSDRRVYAAILAHEVEVFRALVDGAARAMIDCDAGLVVSDSVEACEPVHDLCAVIARLAARRGASALGHPIAQVEFPIERRPSAAVGQTEGLKISLDRAAARRKLDAVKSVPALGIEFERLLERDPDLVETEWLTPVAPDRPLLAEPQGEPFYERQGRERVAEGVFDEAITYARHVAPLVAALAASYRPTLRRAPDPVRAG